jgi:hypothetical protein
VPHATASERQPSPSWPIPQSQRTSTSFCVQ